MSDSGLNELNAVLARVPSVERVLSSAPLQPLLADYGRTRVLNAVRAELERWRSAAQRDPAAAEPLDESRIAAAVAQTLAAQSTHAMRTVFNLTGTVLHTNLGRALLPDDAVRAVVDALTKPVTLEFDLASGRRGDRDDIVDALLRELTGAEAATVVNNNAAAVLLALAALAPKREVVVSRGELVEIGGAFRIPDIMSRAGAKLREVGTTNRTHLHDYADAIGPRTALLMKVHCSNYAVTGFTKETTLAELAPLARAHGLPSRSISAAACSPISRSGGCRTRRPCRKPSRPARISSRSAATSCSAARRPA